VSVYVDDLMVYPNARGIFRAGSCHLAADTLDELHEFAARLGMRRTWFQGKNPRHPHYDLVKSRRDKAVALGAKQVSGRDLIMLWRAQREAAEMKPATGAPVKAP
jgi:hypothetical protein